MPHFFVFQNVIGEILRRKISLSVSGKVDHTNDHMSFSSSLVWSARHGMHVVAETLGLGRDQHTRNVEMYYEVSLKNISAFSQSCVLILPEPQSRHTQTLYSPVQYTPKPSDVRTEIRYGNTFSVWNLTLAPQEEIGIEQQVMAELKPTETRDLLSAPETVNDYREEDREPVERFLAPSAHLQLSREHAAALLQKLSPKSTPVSVLLKEIQEIVCETLNYGNPIPGLYGAEESFTKKIVDCGGFDTLFVALCQHCGIPARVVGGFWAIPSKLQMHAWVEALHPTGRWMPVDPSVVFLHRHKRTNRSGSIGFVGSDRIAYSHGCDLALEIENKIVNVDLLQTPTLLQEAEEIKMTHTFTSQQV